MLILRPKTSLPKSNYVTKTQRFWTTPPSAPLFSSPWLQLQAATQATLRRLGIPQPQVFFPRRESNLTVTWLHRCQSQGFPAHDAFLERFSPVFLPNSCGFDKILITGFRLCEELVEQKGFPDQKMKMWRSKNENLVDGAKDPKWKSKLSENEKLKNSPKIPNENLQIRKWNKKMKTLWSEKWNPYDLKNENLVMKGWKP